MPMKMGWRWYGEGNDPVTLSDIKQIPGVTSIVWALHNKMPGEIWEIGLDWGAFNNRLTGSFGYYDRKTFEVKARPITKIEGLRPGMSLVIK